MGPADYILEGIGVKQKLTEKTMLDNILNIIKK